MIEEAILLTRPVCNVKGQLAPWQVDTATVKRIREEQEAAKAQQQLKGGAHAQALRHHIREHARHELAAHRDVLVLDLTHEQVDQGLARLHVVGCGGDLVPQAPDLLVDLAALEASIRAVTAEHELPQVWHWRRRQETLRDSLYRLPVGVTDHEATVRAVIVRKHEQRV